MSWRMVFVHGDGSRANDYLEKVVENLEDGIEWGKAIEAERHGARVKGVFKESVFSVDEPDFKQWGTNYHYLCATRAS